MKKREIFLLFLVLLIGAMVFPHAGCQRESAEPPAISEVEKITLGLAMQPTNALTILSLEKGFFRDEGLQVTTKEFPSGKRALNDGLLSGEVGIAVSSDIPVVLAGLKGKQFSIIASVATTDNVNRIIARKDRGIVKPSDLTGKKLSTQKASAVHYFLSLFLAEHGIGEKDVEFTYLKAEELPESLAKGSIDAFSMREPFIGMAKSRLGENAVIFSLPGEYNQTDFVLASKEVIQKRPNVIPGVLKALLKAEAYARNNPEDAQQIVGKRLAADPAAFTTVWGGLRLRVGLEQASLLLLEEQARWGIDLGLSDLEKVPNFLELFYFEPLESVKPEAITVIR